MMKESMQSLKKGVRHNEITSRISAWLRDQVQIAAPDSYTFKKTLNDFLTLNSMNPDLLPLPVTIPAA